jgi:hypothetical protein
MRRKSMRKHWIIAIWLAACFGSLVAVAQPAPVSTAATSFRYASGPITAFSGTPTDWVTLTGSASKAAVNLTSLSICGTATAPATLDLLLIRRSSADAGGSSTPAVAANLNGTNVAATTSVLTYTVNPTTLGTAAGNVDVKKLNVGPAGTAGCLFVEFGTRNTAPVSLRGATNQLAVNFNGAAPPAGLSLSFMFEIVEQ